MCFYMISVFKAQHTGPLPLRPTPAERLYYADIHCSLKSNTTATVSKVIYWVLLFRVESINSHSTSPSNSQQTILFPVCAVNLQLEAPAAYITVSTTDGRLHTDTLKAPPTTAATQTHTEWTAECTRCSGNLEGIVGKQRVKYRSYFCVRQQREMTEKLGGDLKKNKGPGETSVIQHAASPLSSITDIIQLKTIFI